MVGNMGGRKRKTIHLITFWNCRILFLGFVGMLEDETVEKCKGYTHREIAPDN